MQAISEAAVYTLRFINQTHRSIFLTGKAGTGKTTLLREIIESTHKNTVVVAPTGIAALNAGGVTIHSMFQLPFGGFIPDYIDSYFSETMKFETKNTLTRHFKMSGIKRSVLQSMELLVIDEVSMLRADLLDAIDFMLQSVRKKKQPFGGVQVLFIGDLLQLPPVVKDEEWGILRKYYTGKFFFHAQVLQQNPPLYIELSKVFRQSDDQFIAMLNNLRNNKISEGDMHSLNQYVQPDFDFKANQGYITLTTHNAKADGMNAQALEDLEGKNFSYLAEIVGEFPEKIYPIEQALNLKIEAQVMFVKNDLSSEKNYFNGKIGTIKSLSKNEILVNFPEDNKTISVEKYEWKHIRYNINNASKDIEEEVLGTFVHYPIKLAWAITVHKSQGLTFDKAALDVSQVFLPGQAYVALSRLRSLEGLVLLSPMRMNGISNDQDVMAYAQNKASDQDLKDALQHETKVFVHQYLKNCFNWNYLAQEWKNHENSYDFDTEKSLKSRQKAWAKTQAEAMNNTLAFASKFRVQLDKIFSAEVLDIQYLAERINAAYLYFFNPLDELVFNLLLKLEEVKRSKKAKLFFEELSVLEELQVKSVLQLIRAKLMVQTLLNGQEISKNVLQSDEIKNYKIQKLALAQEAFKALNISIVEEDESPQTYTTKKVKIKGVIKKSTYEETFELWQQKKSIEEIAEIRKFSVGTIFGHLAKLVQAGQLEIEDVLSSEKIEELNLLFANYTDEALGPLKEQVGERYSWDELRLFKAKLKAG